MQCVTHSVSEFTSSVVALGTKSARLQRLCMSVVVVINLCAVTEVLLVLMCTRESLFATALFTAWSSSSSFSPSLWLPWSFRLSELNWLKGFPRIPKLSSQRSWFSKTCQVFTTVQQYIMQPHTSRHYQREVSCWFSSFFTDSKLQFSFEHFKPCLRRLKFPNRWGACSCGVGSREAIRGERWVMILFSVWRRLDFLG